MGKSKELPTIKPNGMVCNCCGGAERHLAMETVLYNGFGGWLITKNETVFYQGDTNAEWEAFKTLAEIENDAKKEPDADWRAVCFTPLHGETYQRQNDKWVLVEQNEGFA